MIKIEIAGKTVVMGKFFGQADKTAAIEGIGDVQSILFVDTPSTNVLAETIAELQGKGIEMVIRDHHDEPNPRNERGEQIRDAAIKVRNLVSDTVISTREAHPACSLLMTAGEFDSVDAVVADPDPDGLLGTMKALGVVYPELDSDAAVLDGARSEQTSDRLSTLANLLVKGMATLPPFNPKNPAIAEKAKGDLFSSFVSAVQGDAEARSSLEQKVEAYEAGVSVAKDLIFKASEPTKSVALVDAVGSPRHDLMTLTRGLERRDGAKVTVIRKDIGPIASQHGIQYSLAVVKRFQEEVNLQETLPEGFESSPKAGIISNTTFLLHVNEQVWNETVLPALQVKLG